MVNHGLSQEPCYTEPESCSRFPLALAKILPKT